jgi:glutathione S-transferase
MAKLYYFETLNPRKVCAVAKHLALPLEYVRLDPLKGEHRTPDHIGRNPNAKVPVLVDGETRLWESLAIMVYLAGRAGSDLWPVGDAARQAEIVRWTSWDAMHFYPKAASFYFEHWVKARFGLGPASEAALAAATPGFHTAAKILDAHLEGRRFVVGDTLTLADVCLGGTLPYAEEIQLPIAAYAHIRRWHDRMMELPAWRDPWPSPSKL